MHFSCFFESLLIFGFGFSYVFLLSFILVLPWMVGMAIQCTCQLFHWNKCTRYNHPLQVQLNRVCIQLHSKNNCLQCTPFLSKLYYHCYNHRNYIGPLYKAWKIHLHAQYTILRESIQDLFWLKLIFSLFQSIINTFHKVACMQQNVSVRPQLHIFRLFTKGDFIAYVL